MDGEEAVSDEATRVLSRLERIEALEQQQASAGRLLDELRELVREAETWTRSEGCGRAGDAAAKVRERTEGMS